MTVPKHGHDWFALGGILINDEDISQAKQMIVDFRSCWPQMGDAPFHSSDIRGSHGAFKWLGQTPGTFEAFAGELATLLHNLPVIGLACVIDRPGYNRRYQEKYGRQRWSLCKTAFAIAVERATKLAIAQERKLRIYIERSSKKDDQKMQEYYDILRDKGHWFNPATAEKYSPSASADYRQTLYEFRTKQKSSPLMQIADLYLWPICMGGYEQDCRPYRSLLDAGKLIDCSLSGSDVDRLGIKYSCFDSKP